MLYTCKNPMFKTMITFCSFSDSTVDKYSQKETQCHFRTHFAIYCQVNIQYTGD